MTTCRNRALLILCVIILSSLVACNTSTSLDEAPIIRLGEDICDECNMIIDDSRFAASYTTNSGNVRRFDDIGDMLVYDQKYNEDVHIFWVHDYNTGEWINAEQATFVFNADLTSPMAWGLVAFSDSTTADEFIIQNSGEKIVLATLLQEIATGGIDPSTFHDHHGEASENMEQEMNHDHNAHDEMEMNMGDDK